MVTLEQAQQELAQARTAIEERRRQISQSQQELVSARQRVTRQQAIRSQDISGLARRRKTLQAIGSYGAELAEEEAMLTGKSGEVAGVEQEIKAAEEKLTSAAQQQRNVAYAKKLLLKGEKGESIALSEEPAVRKIYMDLKKGREDLVKATLKQIEGTIGEVSAVTEAMVRKTITEKGRLDTTDIRKIEKQVYEVEKQTQVPVSAVGSYGATKEEIKEFQERKKTLTPTIGVGTIPEQRLEPKPPKTLEELRGPKKSVLDYATLPVVAFEKYVDTARRGARFLTYKTIEKVAPKFGERTGPSLGGTVLRYEVLTGLAMANRLSKKPLTLGRLSEREKFNIFVTATKITPHKSTKEELADIAGLGGQVIALGGAEKLIGAASGAASPWIRGAGVAAQVGVGASFGVAGGLSLYEAAIGPSELRDILEKKSLFDRKNLYEEDIIYYRDKNNQPLAGIISIPDPREYGFTGNEPEWRKYEKEIQENNRQVAKQYIRYNRDYKAGKVIGGIAYSAIGFGFLRSGISEAVKTTTTAITPSRPKVSRQQATVSEKTLMYKQVDIVKIPKTYVREDTLIKQLGREVGLKGKMFQPTRVQVSPSIKEVYTTKGPVTGLDKATTKFDVQVRGVLTKERILPKTTKFTSFKGYGERPIAEVIIRPRVTGIRGNIILGESMSTTIPIKGLRRLSLGGLTGTLREPALAGGRTVTTRLSNIELGKFPIRPKTIEIRTPKVEIRKVMAGRIPIYDIETQVPTSIPFKTFKYPSIKKSVIEGFNIRWTKTTTPAGPMKEVIPYRTRLLKEITRYQQVSALKYGPTKIVESRIRLFGVKEPIGGVTMFKGTGSKTPLDLGKTTKITQAQVTQQDVISMIVTPPPKIPKVVTPTVQTPKVSTDIVQTTTPAQILRGFQRERVEQGEAFSLVTPTKMTYKPLEDVKVEIIERGAESILNPSAGKGGQKMVDIQVPSFGQATTPALITPSALITPTVTSMRTPAPSPPTQDILTPPKVTTPITPSLNVKTLKSAIGKLKTISAFDVFVKRKGKFTKVAEDLPLGKALKKGATITKGTLASTFRLVKDKKITYETDISYKPEQDIFRTYQIKRGKTIPLPQGPTVFEFIERRKKRLKTGGEFAEIKAARRSKQGWKGRRIFGL